jgi:aspartate aminotransferase-like enzyme
VIDALEQRGFLVGGPLDRRQPSLLRIGHMGDLEPEHLTTLLDQLSEVIGRNASPAISCADSWSPPRWR